STSPRRGTSVGKSPALATWGRWWVHRRRAGREDASAGGQHMAVTEAVAKDLKGRSDPAPGGLERELAEDRAGRASPSRLEGVRVNYYGTPTPLSGVASLAVPEPRLITVKPWEKGLLKDVEKALREANLGLTPMNDGEIIRLPIPALTEERRKEIAKQVRTKRE